jgi:plastocyanin
MSFSRSFLSLVSLAGVLLLTSGAGAMVPDQPLIQFENHHFSPQTLNVPAGQKLEIKVVNNSQETIEFESFKLNREKVVTPGETITVHLPELSAGNYDFYDDFHQDVPEGTIVAK